MMRAAATGRADGRGGGWWRRVLAAAAVAAWVYVAGYSAAGFHEVVARVGTQHEVPRTPRPPAARANAVADGSAPPRCKLDLATDEDASAAPAAPKRGATHTMHLNATAMSAAGCPAARLTDPGELPCRADGGWDAKLLNSPLTATLTTPPNYAGTVRLVCGDALIAVEVRPVADYPEVAEVERHVTVAVPRDHAWGDAVVVADVVRGVAAGPAGAVDEDYESLFSPLYCDARGDVATAEPSVIQIRDMQITVSEPTVGALHFYPMRDAFGIIDLQCVLRDTSGLQTVLPWIRVSVVDGG